MRIWDQIKHIPGGIGHLTDWLGSGGSVVDQETAQHRANTCQTCALNKRGSPVTTAVALAIRGQLGVKNKLKLRVDGEKGLHNCDACGCVLRLLVWQPQERIEMQISEDEMMKLPSFCWKVKHQ